MKKTTSKSCDKPLAYSVSAQKDLRHDDERWMVLCFEVRYNLMRLTRITQYGKKLAEKRTGLLALNLLLVFFAYAQPNADFTASVTAGCAPLTVRFTNNSTSSSPATVQIQWDLGNGVISTGRDAATVYNNPGVYTVKLTIKDATGEDIETKLNYITVYAKPDVNFSVSPATGCIPLTVSFTDLSDPGAGASIQNWVWDFGDGSNSSAEQNPTHTYTSPGSFNVSLLVVSDFGCQNSIIKQAVVTPVDSVHADFTYDYTNICNPPTVVNFTNTSVSQSPLSFKWDFGNGSTSQGKDPSSTYSTSGAYNVQLIATNDAGCADTVTHPISIGNITADFTFPNGLCVNEPALMTDASSTVPVSATWNFGDGQRGTGLSVTHTYTNTGTYTVIYTADFNGCTSVIRKEITVTDKPVPGFSSASTLTSCQAPLPVQFTNTSTGSVTYEWNFGDGITSTDANPAHTYTTTGNFTVTLTAISAGGCRATYTRTNYVRINQPNITGFTNLPFQGCSPSTVPFKAIISSPEPVGAYLWNFGDGTTSNEEAPEHTYTATGTFNVTLTITTKSGCTDTYTLTAAVVISPKPEADFKAEPLGGCASEEIQFRDQSTGDVNRWTWRFGDGGTSSTPNPLYHYADTGVFTVTLIVESDGCKDTVEKKDLIFIEGTIANMDVVQYCDTPYLKRFKDASVDPKTWAWDFGDGSTSTDQNPAHTYAAPGTFSVRLITTNASCADTTFETVNVIDEHPTFTTVPIDGNYCKNISIQFTLGNVKIENVKGVRWIFDDGFSTSFSLAYDTILHVYKTPGTYDQVKMIVNYINGCYDTVTQTLNINGPTAAFTNGPGTCAGNSFTFTDQSVPYGGYDINRWVWDYGDGTTETSTAPPFDHVYADSGTYNVLLKVYDTYGCYDSVYKTAAVIIGKPYAAFTTKDPLRCTSSAVEFINQSAGLSLQYSWSFGDGGTSTSASPSHLYAAEGRYTVSLTVTDIYGCTNTIVKTDSVIISNPVAAFSISDDYSRCTLPVQATNQSQNYSSLSWDFGDGGTSVLEDPFHLYTVPNTYTITLTAQGYGECFATATQQVKLEGPYGTFNNTNNDGCFPLTVDFTANATSTVAYIWDFGDGVVEETTGNTNSYTYTTPGTFVPRLLLKDISGCTVAIESGDTAYISGVIPKFYATPQTGCDSSLVIFTDTSYVVGSDPIASIIWNYDDGTSSSDAFHYYKQTGRYEVVQTVTSTAGCSSTFTLPVEVLVNKAPKLGFSIPDSACVNSVYSFAAADTSRLTDPLQWLWNIGNGQQFTEQNFDYTYTTPGIYNVSVTATSTLTACADTLNKQLTILALPPVYAGNDTAICINTTATLSPSGAATYVWNTSPSLSCTDCANPLAAPVESTTYYVTGADDFGCKAMDSVWVRVITPTHLTLSVTDDTLCLGSSIELIASGAEKYAWTPPAGLSSTTIPNPVASPTVTTIYQVTGSDSIGCFEDVQTVRLFVAPVPTFNIKDSNVTVSAGSLYTITTTSSPDVISWFWDPPTALNTPSSAQPVVTPRFPLTYKGVATNAFGCSATDTIRIEVLCNNSNVFIPNTFSPNGDGSNDYFLPRGKGLFNIKSMRIFNRWGMTVFEKINFPANTQTRDGAWDGNFAGEKQPSDVYIYVIDIVCDNGIILSYKGNVTLIR